MALVRRRRQERKAARLARMFTDNFKTFEAGAGAPVGAEVALADPVVADAASNSGPASP